MQSHGRWSVTKADYLELKRRCRSLEDRVVRYDDLLTKLRLQIEAEQDNRRGEATKR